MKTNTAALQAAIEVAAASICQQIDKAQSTFPCELKSLTLRTINLRSGEARVWAKADMSMALYAHADIAPQMSKQY